MSIAEEMVVQEVEMPPRKPDDLGKGGIDRLRIVRPAAFEKRFLVTKIADIRTTTRNHNRIGH